MKNNKNRAMLVLIVGIISIHFAQAQDSDSGFDKESVPPLDQNSVISSFENSAGPTVTELRTPAAKIKKKKTHSGHRLHASQSSAGSSFGDDPDFSKEDRFNKIYRKYNEQPTSLETWEKVAGQRKSESYKVQKGDTLWGVSNTFFGDTHFWPKIWSMNDDTIGNPHEIDDSMLIRFFAGNKDQAPTLKLDSVAADNNLLEKKSESSGLTEAAPAARPEVPLSKLKIKPLLAELPRSFPIGHYLPVISNKEKIEMDLLTKIQKSNNEYLPFYASDEPISGQGSIVGTEGMLKSAAEFGNVYVHLEQANEKKYIVQKNRKLDSNLGKDEDDDSFPNIVEVQGEIEVLEPVNKEKNLYRAVVRKNLGLVEVGSLLVPGSLSAINTAETPVISAVGARIIGGEFGSNQNLFGQNSFVIIDAGKNKGVSEGATYNIFANSKTRNREIDAVINERKIGALKIVKVADSFATAYVLKASDDINKGDYVGDISKVISPDNFQSNAEDSFKDNEIDNSIESSSSSDDSSDSSEFDKFDDATDSGNQDSELQL